MIMEAAQEYWFTLEPYVYVELKENVGLLYNTLDSCCIEVNNIPVLSLLATMQEVENGGVVSLTSEELKDENMAHFISLVREKYMGDLYDKNLSKRKPVQLYPLLNFQRDKKRIEESGSGLGDDIMSNLYEITLYLSVPEFDTPDFSSSTRMAYANSEADTVDIATLCSFLAPILPNISVLNIKGGLFEYPYRKQLFDFLDKFSCKKNYFICGSQINLVETFLFSNGRNFLSVYIDRFFDCKRWKDIVTLTDSIKDYCSFLFLVDNEDRFTLFSEVIEKYSLSRYSFIPIYLGDNYDFFKKNVFISKVDIFSEKLSLRDIYRHKTLNSNDFGKISILPDGSIFANVNLCKLGNIQENTISEVLYKELKEGQSWLRIKDQGGCCSCIYQWLCPSPSNYELIIGKPNLCDIHE